MIRNFLLYELVFGGKHLPCPRACVVRLPACIFESAARVCALYASCVLDVCYVREWPGFQIGIQFCMVGLDL